MAAAAFSGGATRDDDFVEHFFVASTHAYLLCFTTRGQLYWLKVLNVPEGSRVSAGRAMANVLELKAEERISSVIPVRRLDADAADADGLHLLMATRRGLVKKTGLRHYCRPKAGGIIGLSLEEGDTLIGVALVRPGDEVLLCTRDGMAIRFDEGDARPMGRRPTASRGSTSRATTR
ncbi:MAG: DNA gyrase C-terminal beta-propeller domain-containing protein [Gemmataceae bacterium]